MTMSYINIPLKGTIFGGLYDAPYFQRKGLKNECASYKYIQGSAVRQWLVVPKPNLKRLHHCLYNHNKLAVGYKTC